ncbi:hypothetical protein [Comamonas thiooxydans]|uniref:hypothetical protein n=1 Tax=Comamonas thiooxydans TaxID=363952 RepID=UPI000A7A86B9|nr:hypothetical protein [Comamonas thiooxydans]
MRIEFQGSKVYLVNDAGVLHVSGTLFLNQVSVNPHTIAILARSLRVWARLASAFDIDLAARALQGVWLTEGEKRSLRYLVFRPIEEIESMSDRDVRHISSPTRQVEQKSKASAVARNTALKQLVGIAKYLTWFHTRIIAPRLPPGSSLSACLQTQVDACSRDLKAAVTSTQTSNPFRIRSVPTERFLQIYSAVFLSYQKIFKTASGRPSVTASRDRAIVLLAGEGVRPGAIGNLARGDFRWEGKNSPGYITFKDNTSRRGKKIGPNTPVQKGAASHQAYNSLVTIQVWPTTAQAIQDYIDGDRSTATTRGLKNRSQGFLFLAEHGGPIGDRGTITRVFRQARRGLTEAGLLHKDPKDPYLEGDAYDFHAYLLRHSSASLFFSTKSMTMKSEVVMDLMKMRFGWSSNSAMPTLYARRAMSDAASLTIEDFMDALLVEARSVP